MTNQQEIKNDELLEVIKRLKSEDKDDNLLQSDFIKAIVNATLIAPVEIKTLNENEDPVATFTSLVNFENDHYFMVFTDMENFLKWDNAEGKRLAQIPYEKLSEIVLNQEANYTGFVINPFSENATLGKENISVMNNFISELNNSNNNNQNPENNI